MEKDQLISVVVPVYKVEEYLNKCIDSILNQTYKNLEIILVDDGSPDNCPAICDEYAKKDNRIRVIHKKNGGLSSARNEGIKAATGEYIGFVDSDDYIDEKMFEYLINLIKKYDADISVCGCIKIFEDGKQKSLKFEKEVCLDTNGALKALATNHFVGNYAWNKLYKASLFKKYKVEYPVGKIMEDVATTYKLFENARKVSIGTEKYYYYLQRKNSIMGAKNYKTQKQFLSFLIDRYEHFKNNNDLAGIFYKSVLLNILAIYVDGDKELLSFLKEEKVFEEWLKKGKERKYFNCLTIREKIRIYIFRFNKRIYKLMILFLRKVKK